MIIRKLMLSTAFLISTFLYGQNTDSTYAEKLGYPKGSKVLILHVDDLGMSFDSNEGAINAMTKGVANSCSVMMPCPWVPGIIHYFKEHPGMDAGLHLTLTSEWKEYRWGPLSGKKLVNGLTDPEGALWPLVEDVVKHATADEVEIEINAQLDRARAMGFEPTHIDTHMGTMLASVAFTEKYMKLGIRNHIPIMLPAGNASIIKEQMHASDALVQQMRFAGKILWNAGLPVIDDLNNGTYGWTIPKELWNDDKKIQAYKTRKYIESLKDLHPGITMIIMHCTATSPIFEHISDSGPVRKGDMLAMMDPAFKQALADQGIILTTWRELKERRDRLH